MKFSIRDLLLLTTIVALTVGWAIEKNHAHQLTTQLQTETKKTLTANLTITILTQQITILKTELIQHEVNTTLLEVERQVSENYRNKLKTLTGTPVEAPPGQAPQP